MVHAKELRLRDYSYRIACERKEMKARPLSLAQSTPKRLFSEVTCEKPCKQVQPIMEVLFKSGYGIITK
jgi:hypothetical protein